MAVVATHRAVNLGTDSFTDAEVLHTLPIVDALRVDYAVRRFCYRLDWRRQKAANESIYVRRWRLEAWPRCLAANTLNFGSCCNQRDEAEKNNDFHDDEAALLCNLLSCSTIVDHVR